MVTLHEELDMAHKTQQKLDRTVKHVQSLKEMQEKLTLSVLKSRAVDSDIIEVKGSVREECLIVGLLRHRFNCRALSCLASPLLFSSNFPLLFQFYCLCCILFFVLVCLFTR